MRQQEARDQDEQMANLLACGYSPGMLVGLGVLGPGVRRAARAQGGPGARREPAPAGAARGLQDSAAAGAGRRWAGPPTELTAPLMNGMAVRNFGVLLCSQPGVIFILWGD
jgi:hypothetical protein